MSETPEVGVLLVDDREENLLALEVILERPGRTLRRATSGNEALGILLEHDFACVLLDVQMPEMDGFEVARLMRTNPKVRRIPIIFITAASTAEDYVFQGYEAGAVDYLLKPFNPEILASKVDIFCELHAARMALERSEESFRSLLEAVPDGLVVVDRDREVTRVNKAVEEMFGYRREGLIGRSPGILVPTVEGVEGLEAELERPASPLSRRAFGQRSDGSTFPIDLSVKPLTSDARDLLVASIRDSTERVRSEEEIRRLAFYDSLTELPNRQLFREHLQMAVESAKREKRSMAVLFIDLNRFKAVNDTFGHHIGDELLRQVGRRFRGSVRSADSIGRLQSESDDPLLSRWGGDEFTVLLSDISGPAGAELVAERLHDSLATPIEVDGHGLSIGASIGIAIHPDCEGGADGLLAGADAAMYRAKERGPVSTEYHSARMKGVVSRRLHLENLLRGALERQELLLHYQPVFDAETGRMTAVEALIRWNSPDEGFISPEEFIPIAEESGLIVTIGEWVLHTACMQARAWRDDQHPPIRMAVNVSPRQLQQSGWSESVGRALEDTGLGPSELEIELTESAILQPDVATVESLESLHRMGVGLSLDDFGTGYSSLSYLNRFPIGRVKIDRAFVRDVATEATTAPIARAILAMARCLGVQVVAEGVETEEQAAYLRTHGCHELQGFLLSRPVPADEVEEYLEPEEKEATS